MDTIMELQHINKSFAKKQVVKDLSFQIDKGEILCLLGPNGAGKSTTINMISGILKQDQGMISYQGNDIIKMKKQYLHDLGVVPQDLALYEDLSADQNIRFFASLYGLKKTALDACVQKALAFSELTDRAGDKVKTFSGGMKRRLNIACAIAHQPKLVIMDEPTVGIDPQSRNHILTSIRELQKEGMSILYTTHYMEEVEAIADRIIIMDHGEMIAEGTKETLKDHLSSQRTFVLTLANAKQICTDHFYSIEGVKQLKVTGSTVTISTLKNIENLDDIIGEVLHQNLQIINLYCQDASLETVFLELTGRSLRD